MAEPMLFWCPQCQTCRHLADRPIDERTRCIQCDIFFPNEGRLFGQADWKTSNDPFRMAAALHELKHAPSERKWRLLACGIGRTEFEWCRNPWFRDALDLAEKWADTGERPRSISECANQFTKMPDTGYHRSEALGWVRIARRVVADDPQLKIHDMSPPRTRSVSAALLRDLVYDPFGSPVWNSDWLTSSVRDLAAHIYERREFDTMPILADALQEAGCENRQILHHCRENKLHARGCWLLDAILGKS